MLFSVIPLTSKSSTRISVQFPCANRGHHERFIVSLLLRGVNAMGAIGIGSVCYPLVRTLDPSNRWPSVAETPAANIQRNVFRSQTYHVPISGIYPSNVGLISTKLLDNTIL